MEQVATVEQAEPQGSAAPAEPASAPSFGSLFRAHVERRPSPASTGTNGATQPGASSGNAETSATDEQPASDAPLAGQSDTSEHGTETDTATPEQKLSRSQRKALKQATAQGDTSATETAGEQPPAGSPDVVSRVERLEQLVQQSAPPSPEDAQYLKEYAETFGDDAEFARLSHTYVHDRDHFPVDRIVEFERWADNRRPAQLTDLKWKRNLTAAALAAAQEHGVDTQAILSASNPASIFAAFATNGKGSSDALATVTQERDTWKAKAEKLEAANRQIADEAEALRQRAPAASRGFVSGGLSAVPSAVPPIDRQKASGRQLMAHGIANPARQGRGRDANGYVRPG